MGLAFALLLSVVPGVYAWLVGRRLVGFADDPALPERLQIAGRNSTIVFATAVALLLVLAWDHAFWAVPLAVLGSLAGGFPARRVLYGETGSFFDLLGRLARLWSAMAGFWILLAFSPLLVRLAPGNEPIVAALLASLLVLWPLAEDRAALASLGVRPLDRPDLEPTFAPVLARAKLSPLLYRLPARGGRWANALAISSRTRPAVVFTEGLLDLLDARETAAILGHEVAHLEHWTKPRLVRRAMVQVALVFVGILLVPFLGGAAGDWRWLVFVAWPLALLFGLAIRASRHQAQEAESDRRAVELSGDAEGLVSALVKLHAAARLPSRWQREAERAATHPSLAKRVHAIRAAGGAAAAEATPLVVRSIEPGRYVVLDGDRISWLDAVPGDTAEDPATLREAAGRVRRVAYRELADLRVRAGLSGDARLVATDCGGESWSLAIRREDVAALQASLDRADPHLAARSTSFWLHPLPGAIVGLVVMIGGVLAAPIPASLLAALLAAIRTTTPTLAACGVSALASAALIARESGGSRSGLGLLGIGLLAAGGAAALLLALVRARREDATLRGRGIELALAILALGAAIVWLLAAAAIGTKPDLVAAHRHARALPGTATLMLGLAAALACWPRRRARILTAVVACLGLVPMLVGSRWFATHLAHDPLQSAAPALEVVERRLEPISVERLENVSAGLRIAPDGAAYAIQGPAPIRDGDEDVGYAPGPFRFGPEPTVRGTLDALDLEFIDAERVLALVEAPHGLELRLLRIDALANPVRTTALRELDTGSLEVDVAAGRWLVDGVTRDVETKILALGRIDEDAVDLVRWRFGPVASESGYDELVGSRAGAIVVRTKYELAAPAALLPFLGGTALHTRSQLWLGAEPERRRLLADSSFAVTCHLTSVSADERPFLCLAHDGIDTHIWEVEPASGERRSLGFITSHLFAFSGPGEGTLAGWDEHHRLTIVDVGRRRVERVAFSLPDRPLGTAFAGRRVGVVHFDGTGATLAVYDLVREDERHSARAGGMK